MLSPPGLLAGRLAPLVIIGGVLLHRLPEIELDLLPAQVGDDDALVFPDPHYRLGLWGGLCLDPRLQL